MSTAGPIGAPAPRQYRYYEFVMAAFVTVLICANLIGPAIVSFQELMRRKPDSPATDSGSAAEQFRLRHQLVLVGEPGHPDANQAEARARRQTDTLAQTAGDVRQFLQ